MDGNGKATAGSNIHREPRLSEVSSSEDGSERKSAVMPAGSARGLHRYRIDDHEEGDNEDDDKSRSAINPTRNYYHAAKVEESKETSVG